MFLETPTFPGCPSFGMVANPRYNVSIGQTISARERRNANWERALNAYTVTVGPRMEGEIQELLEFWHAVGGPEIGFRFKDWSDFKSCRVHLDPTALDQPTQLIPGSPGGYQLLKVYRAGILARTRQILKPIASTIVLADNGVEQAPGSYTVEESTGLVQLGFVPAGEITWGGEFDVPVRFDSEFPIDLVTYKIESVSFTLAELRDPDAD